MQGERDAVPDTKKTYKTPEDRPDPNPFPVEATVKPKGRWAAVWLWLFAAALVEGLVGIWGLFSIAERLRHLVVVMEGK